MKALCQISCSKGRMIKGRGAFTLIELLIVVAIIAILAAIAVPNFLEAQTRAKVARVKADMRTIATAIEAYHIDYNSYPMLSPYSIVDGRVLVDLFHRFDNFIYFEGGHLYLGPGGGCPTVFTTPVAYLSAHPPKDPFIGNMKLGQTGCGYNTLFRRNCSYYFYSFIDGYRHRRQLHHQNPNYPDRWALVVSPAPIRLNGPDGPVHPANWALLSPGPDRTFDVPDPDAPEWHGGEIGTPWTSFRFFHSPRQWNAMKEGRHSVYDPTNGSIRGGDIWRTNQGVL